jgi:tRNA (cytidine32/uridine32-2'-O)-methyltransferase
MKTMGLDELVLVQPKRFPSPEASARASGAEDLLERVRVAASLDEAVADCGFIVGASARLRGVRWPAVDPATCAEALLAHAEGDRVALLMGPEQSGLTNEDLARCHRLVHIPSVERFGSLNLAMALQVLCYELRMAQLRREPLPAVPREAPLATAAELEGFHRHLERVLADAGFLHPEHQRKMKLKLRRIFQRAQLDQNEINILRGVLASLDPARRAGAGADAET